MDINVVHRYSHQGETLLRTIYNALGFKLTVPLQVCNGCAKSKTKACLVRKINYTRVSHPGESIFVDTTGPFPEILIGNQYWIGVLDNYSCYSWSFFTKKKASNDKKEGRFF